MINLFNKSITIPKNFNNFSIFCLGNPLNTIEVLTKRGWEKIDPNVPFKSSESCMVLVNSTTVFLIGGKLDNKISLETYFLNTDDIFPEWIHGPKLTTLRYGVNFINIL